MALFQCGSANSEWSTLETIASNTYGTLYGTKNSRLKLAMLTWEGNDQKPPSNTNYDFTYTASQKQKYEPITTVGSPMRYDTEMIYATPTMIQIFVAGNKWYTQGTLTYPTVN